MSVIENDLYDLGQHRKNQDTLLSERERLQKSGGGDRGEVETEQESVLVCTARSASLTPQTAVKPAGNRHSVLPTVVFTKS